MTSKRKAAKNEIDKVRDKTPKRLKMHQNINKRPQRKLQLSNYEQTEKRIHYRKIRDAQRYQASLLTSLKTETGFDVICHSCLQYKSKHLCKPLECMSKAKIEK